MKSFTSLCLIVAAIAFCNAAKVLPAPTNATYGTDIIPIELIDFTRKDPYDPNDGLRKLMLSAIYPTLPFSQCSSTNASTYPYAPPISGTSLDSYLQSFGFSNGSTSLANATLLTCPSNATQAPGSFPVVLFSHGSTLSRLLSNAQAQSVAAQGFIVLTIDHPYNAHIVEYLEGSIINGIPFVNNSILDSDIRTRSQDASFVLDQIRNGSSVLRQTLPQLSGNEKVGIWGHSLGGATAARVAYDDDRFLAALNLDGYPYGFNTSGNFSNPTFVLPENITSPFLLFSAAPSINLEPYIQFYDSFSGYKKQLSLADSQHLAFEDIPLLADVLGGRSQVLESYTGTISGLRARDAVATYVAAFMGWFLKDGGAGDGGLLEGPSERWPEVGFVRCGSGEC